MVLFVGDVASDQRDREAFQEVDYASFFGPSTKGMAKRVERIDEPDRIPEYVARAFATAMNGRPGPVVLVLPEDMLTQHDGGPAAGRGWSRCEAWSDPGALRTLREMLLAVEASPSSSPAAAAGRRRRRRRCSASPRTGSCRWATPSASRTPSTTTIRCTRATWASASIPSWPRASRTAT